MSGGKLQAAIAPKRVLEGVLPLPSPHLWRAAFRETIVPNEGQLRFVGLAFMLSSLLILLASHSHA